MPFSYYSRLSARNQAIYRASDRVSEVRLPRPERLRPLCQSLRSALASEDRRAVATAARALSDALLGQLGVTPLAVKVLAVRPSSRWGELHGLYTASEKAPAEIRLWMRTVRHKQVVAFRTFLRTLLHELGHHLDYRYLKLPDSFHTEGFFRRESSLVRQIVPGGEAARARAGGRTRTLTQTPARAERETARTRKAPRRPQAPERPAPAAKPSLPTPPRTKRRPPSETHSAVGGGEAPEPKGPVQGWLSFEPEPDEG